MKILKSQIDCKSFLKLPFGSVVIIRRTPPCFHPPQNKVGGVFCFGTKPPKFSAPILTYVGYMLKRPCFLAFWRRRRKFVVFAHRF